MPSAASFNPAAITDPSLVPDQQAVDQRLQLANLLLQQGLAPMGGTESVGGVAIRRSPFEGAAKIAALLSGQSLQDQANQMQRDVAMRQSLAFNKLMQGTSQPSAATEALGEGAQQGSVGPTPSNANRMDAISAQRSASPPTGGPLSIPGMSPEQNMLSFMLDPAAHMKALQDQYAMTPDMKTAAAAYGRGSQPYQKALQAEVTKAGYIAPLDPKAGTVLADPITHQPFLMMPKTADGIGLDFSDPLRPKAYPLPGYASANAGISGAQKAAESANSIQNVTLSDGRVVPMWAGSAAGGTGAPSPAPQSSESGPQVTNSAPRSGGSSPTPRVQPQPLRIGQSTADAAAATEAGKLPQKSLEDQWTQLRQANSQAQVTNSYLQSIKDLAAKTPTGQFADRQQLANSLLSLVGNERATDEASAKNLLDKFSNQITARLGQGNLGTDAARTLIASAYPNSGMTKQAIAEAVDNLTAANNMVQAKSRLLAPYAANRDVAGYLQREQIFDQAADPRIWQYANIRDQNARRSFLQNILRSDPTFMDRAAALQRLGAI